MNLSYVVVHEVGNLSDCALISASAILTQRQDGDVISLAASPHSLSVDTTVSVNGDLHLVRFQDVQILFIAPELD